MTENQLIRGTDSAKLEQENTKGSIPSDHFDFNYMASYWGKTQSLVSIHPTDPNRK